ncbi:DUF2793 domain-containing protein [Maricaulis sp.]|uniref:DUF2793 domain-containing protein n=1 Tax=Maricaulis sp. TaxID=1486257 RepID=UPI00261C150E|nr:DUF2793 domain-containing protein [Maricaulis sp.]
MSETSPNLGLPLVMPAQAQKHVTVNEALLRLDVLAQACAESRSVSAQPADPPEGGCWILPAGASGADWSGMMDQSLALFRDGYWSEIRPAAGWRVHVRDEGRCLTFDAGRAAWLSAATSTVLAAGAGGAATEAVLIEEELAGLAGASVSSSVTIPARSVVFCVSVTTTETITGAVSFDCGLSGEASKFGGSLGISAGASNLGVVGPTAFYSDTPIVLTANGGDFAGGSVALAIHAWRPQAPAA